MQIAAKKSAAKIISRTLATISVFVIGWVVIPSFWFWVVFEVLALLLVILGCGGEWYLHVHPAGRKKREQDAHHKLESRFIAAVAVGVLMELFALAHTISEGIKLEKKVTLANTRLEELRRQNLELEVALAWRTITPSQRAVITNDLISFVKKHPLAAFKVKVEANISDTEAQLYAQQIVGVLKECGLDAEAVFPLGFWDPKEPVRFGLFFAINDIKSEHANAIAEAFKKLE